MSSAVSCRSPKGKAAIAGRGWDTVPARVSRAARANAVRNRGCNFESFIKAAEARTFPRMRRGL